jgi:hypothetical protein
MKILRSLLVFELFISSKQKRRAQIRGVKA